MRLTRSVVLMLTLGILVTASCSSSSSDGGGDGGTGAAPTTSDASTYVTGVCTALTDWKDGIDSDQQQLQSALSGQPSPEGAKSALTDFLSSVVDGTKTMVADVKALGAPDVDGGSELAASLNQGLESVSTTFETALAKVQGMSTDDPAALAQSMTALGTDIQNGTSGISDAFNGLDTGELKTAASESAACAPLTS